MTTHICSSCGFNNRSESKFCTKCGYKLNGENSLGPRLLVLTNKKNSIVFRIIPGRSTIGRDIGNAIVINDDQISKYHAAITFENKQVQIEDLESKNGVYLNGKKINDRQMLFNGCLIKLGSTILKFEGDLQAGER